MTLHAAKGLEFPLVYILGVEHNLIPHERAIRTGGAHEYEEERRLLFVGMTRAREELALTQAIRRTFRGATRSSVSSQFTNEAELEIRVCTPDHAPAMEPVAQRLSRRMDHLPGDSSRPLLTTGADLANGTTRSVELPQGFAVGMTVRQPRYGKGTVVYVSGLARRRSVSV